MHFSSISSCDLGATVTVSATNDTNNSKYLYLPALSNFVSIVVGSNSISPSAETRIVVPIGSTVTISVLSPSVNLATVFYEYAASNVSDGSDRYAGYFSITAKSQRNTLLVLNSEKPKKWYNYTAKSHSFVFYDQGSTYSVAPSSSSINLVVPAHIVPDPYTEKTYIYSAETGRLFSSIPTPQIGAKPFAYRKIVVTPDVLFTDLSTAQHSVTGGITKSSLAPAVGRYSAQFNGTTDYLRTDSTVFNLSNQDFTIEFWINPTRIPSYEMTNWVGNRDLVSILLHNGVDTAIGFDSTNLFFIVNEAIVVKAAHGFAVNVWSHVVFSRKNNSLTVFVNGITTASVYYAGSITGGTYTYIGTRGAIGGYFKGNLTNIQVTLGHTVYTPSTYTVPTAGFAVGNSILLSVGLASGSYVNGQSVNNLVVDLKNRNAITTVNNITASTTVTKFSSQSLYFDNAGLKIIDTLAPATKTIINSNDVTIEWWAYPTSSTATQIGFHYGTTTNNDNFSFIFGTQVYTIYADSINNVLFNTYSRTTLSYNAWHHFALVKRGGLYKFYLNGALEFVGNYGSITSVPADTVYFGADGASNNTFKGYIDGLVITTASNETVNNFTPSTTFAPDASAILALDFATVSSQSLSNATRIENYVFVLTSDGTVTKVQVDNSTVAGPKLPSSQATKKINWFLSSTPSYNEDISYIGTFSDGTNLNRSRNLSPGISCVDYYSGTVYVGGYSGIWVMDGETLDLLGNIPTNFGISSIKAIASGFLVTSYDHKIYYLTLSGVPYLIYTATVLGLPDALGNEWFVPDCEQSRLVVINLTTDFVANYMNSVSNISRYVNLDAIFAPSYVAADAMQNLIFICGHDSDVVYYCNGTAPLSSIVFDNKVAWVSANSGTVMASFYLIDAIVLDVALLQRSARVYLDSRSGSSKANIGTRSFRVKMLGRHGTVQITAPKFSNSTTVQLPNGTVFGNGDPVKPTWIQNFESGQISTWANGVRESTDVAHDDYVAMSYKSVDTAPINVNLPYIVGDRHTVFQPTVVSNLAAPKNFFSTKKPNIQPYSTDASCVLMLHMNGISGAVYFQDESITPTVYVGTGTVALTGADSKFDGSSALFGGGYITVTANSNLGFGLKDFTIEFWIKTATTGTTSKLLLPNSQSLGKWAVYLNATGELVWNNGIIETTVADNSLYTNTWRHVAITRSSLTTIIYIDGTPEATFYDDTNYTVAGTGNYLIGGGAVVYGTPNLPVYQTGTGIWASVGGTEATFVRTITVNFPSTGNYVFSCKIRNYGTVSLDGTVLLTIPVSTVTYTSGKVTVAVTAGNHAIGINGFRTSGVGAVKISIVSTTGTIIYDTEPGFSNLSNYSGYMDELRISTVARYNGAVFKPGVPDYAVNSPVRPTNLLNIATFELPLTRLFTPGVAALEYGTLQVNGVLYNGTTLINGFDNITATVPFVSTQTVFAPILRIGVKEFALPINNFNQELTEIVIEISNVDTNTKVDYTGQITIAVAGTYYIPNYSTAFVTAIKQNGSTLTPGTYVELSTGDAIDIYGILSSTRINDTVDVFIIGPENYQISVQTVLTYLPKYMDFGILLTNNAYSGDALVQYGYSTVGNITDPFARFKYQSSALTVTGIPPNDETGDPQPIQLTTDQAFMGATLIRIKPNGDITQKKIITDVFNGDKIQIVKQVYNYLETGIKLQVLYVDSDATTTEVYDVGRWAVVQTEKTADFVPPDDSINFDPTETLRDVAGNYIDIGNAVIDKVFNHGNVVENLGYEILGAESKPKVSFNLELLYSSVPTLAGAPKSLNYKNSSSSADESSAELATSNKPATVSVSYVNHRGISQLPVTPIYTRFNSTDPAIIAIGYNSYIQNAYLVLLQNETYIQNAYFTSLGLDTYIQNAYFTSLGLDTYIQNAYTTSLGNSKHTQEAYTTSLGNSRHFQNAYTTSLGNSKHTQEAYTTSLGNSKHTQEAYTTSLGNTRHFQNAFTTSLGNSKHTQEAYTTSLGNSRHTQEAYTVRFLANSKHTQEAYTTSLGNSRYFQNSYLSNLGPTDYRGVTTLLQDLTPKIYRVKNYLDFIKPLFHDQIDYLNFAPPMVFGLSNNVVGGTFHDILPPMLPDKQKINIFYQTINFDYLYQVTWEGNDNLLSVGAFATEAQARADADSKGYFKYMITKILNNKGVVYFSYRVDFDNQIVCNLTTARTPFYGLIQGG